VKGWPVSAMPMPAGFDLDAMMYRLLQLRVPKVRTLDIACMLNKSLFLIVLTLEREKRQGDFFNLP
jgi:hypothetical protein